MKYHGLHFSSDDNEPTQVRFSMDNQQCWVRTCPQGQWTPWRRLDVMRNADGTLNERVAESSNAKTADKAKSLNRAVTIVLTGDASGSVSFDGSETSDVVLNVSIGALGQTNTSLADLEKRVTRLERNSSNDSWSGN